MDSGAERGKRGRGGHRKVFGGPGRGRGRRGSRSRHRGSERSGSVDQAELNTRHRECSTNAGIGGLLSNGNINPPPPEPPSGPPPGPVEGARVKSRRRRKRRRLPANRNRGETNDMKAANEGTTSMDSKYDGPLTTGASFTELEVHVSKGTMRSINETFRYQNMTLVQEKSIVPALSQKDILAKAKTGTGKTLAFLIPAVEMLAREGLSRNELSVLIISPTRELALQIQENAQKLLRFHQFNSLTVIGGSSVAKDRRLLSERQKNILIGTPGRLVDHIDSTPDFRNMLQEVRMLILDEADVMLSTGFEESIVRIVEHIPTTRQTLLFSATFSNQMLTICKAFLDESHVTVDCIGDEENTNTQTSQEFIVTTGSQQLHILFNAIQLEMREPNHKIIVFSTTARIAGFLAEFSNAIGLKALEIHSRKSQSHRTKTSDTFRKGSKLLLFSSDVSARGVDYPDVSLIIQFGFTEKTDYVHRLGRTGRAGHQGRGLLIVCDYEQLALNDLADFHITETEKVPKRNNSLVAAGVELVEKNEQLSKSAAKAYQSWAGYYCGKLRRLGWTQSQLLENAKSFSSVLGLRKVPALPAKLQGMLKRSGVR